MPYSLPTLASLSQMARRHFGESLPGANLSLWPNPFAVIAKVLALTGYNWHLRLKYLFDQIFVSTADQAWLLRHAYEFGMTQRPASRASGSVTGVATASGAVPSGLVLSAPDSSLYRVKLSASVAAGNGISLVIEAAEPGFAGNLDAGATLTMTDPARPSFLNAAFVVATDGLGGGADAETLEELRARVLERKRNPPQGGSETDWTTWAREASAGVTDVFVDTFSNNDRHVWLAFRMKRRANGIPTAADVAVVQDYVGDPVRRPVTARVTVVAPTPRPVDIVIQGLEPDNVAVRDAIAIELAALFAERMRAATPTRAFVLPRAWIEEAISRAAGEDSHTLGQPVANVAFANPSDLPVLGSVRYI